MLASFTIDGFENIQYQGFGKLKYIENKLSDLYQRYGYCQVETPTFEAYDFFTTGDQINGDDLFKLVAANGKIMALKPDATLQIARMAAINHHDPEEIAKFSYLTNIYRNFPAPDIEKKETTQTGIEYFGNASPSCDAEIVALAILSLKIAGVENIHIDLGHVGLVDEALKLSGLPEEDRRKLFRMIENKNIGDIKDFLNEKPVDPEVREIIIKLPQLFGPAASVLPELQALEKHQALGACAGTVISIFEQLRDLGFADYVSFDLGFTNNMHYYSGMIFKGYIEDYGEPVINGGRYDTLSSRFGIDRPACGFGLDLVLLMDYLEKNDLILEQRHAKSVILYKEKEAERASHFARTKRKTGSAETFLIEEESPLSFVRRLLKNPHYQNADIYLMDEGISYFDGRAFGDASQKHIDLYNEGGTDGKEE